MLGIPSRVDIVLPVLEKKCLKFTDEHSLYTHTYTLVTVHNETHTVGLKWWPDHTS